MPEKMRVGIIGCGWIAHSHMQAYLKMDDVEIVAAADLIPGKARAFLDEFGLTKVPAYGIHTELLEKAKLDAVSICTYNTTHRQCAVDALQAGLDVLCEKPMSVTLQEAVDMAKAQKKTGKILSIGFQPRYDPDMIMVRDLVRSGVLGEIYYVQTGGGRRRGIPGGTFIRKDLAGVGCLADIGCYGLDMALNAINYPKPLTVSAYSSDRFGKNPKYCAEYDQFDVDDFAVAFIRLEGGIALDFRMSWAMHMDTMGDTLFLGTEAGVKVKSPFPDKPWGGAWDGTIGPVFMYHDVAGNLVETKVPSKAVPNFNRFDAKVRAFVDAAKTGGDSPIPASQILYNQAILDGILRSSQLGREVEITIPEI
ncbi:MAG: Gfo/Idh/MocA family oxidoreductase [Christensenellaceae bacterium]|nr:Gfo/Idh/MocA family oxidoreductase [Christensenellaceae bacterium]